MNKREFVRIGVAGMAGALLVPKELMAGMVEPALKTKVAGGVYYTTEAVGRWNEAVADHHLPDFEKSDGQLRVATHHPMSGYEHYIVKHQLLDADFNFISEHRYNPTQDNSPETSFDVSGRSGLVYALTMCNVHDVWVNATEL